MSVDSCSAAGTVDAVLLADALSVLESINTALPVLFAGVLGSVLASFLCVVAERVPRGETLMGRSHCVCGRQLEAGENIPVLGWVATGGRAKCCGARIPARYVLAEIGLGVWFAVAVALWSAPIAAAACAAGCVVCLAVIGAFAYYGDD